MMSKDWLQPAPGANLAGQLSRPSVNGIRRKAQKGGRHAGNSRTPINQTITVLLLLMYAILPTKFVLILYKEMSKNKKIHRTFNIWCL